MPIRPISAPTRKPIRLAPVRPNLGVEAKYQRRIDAMIAAMQRDVARTAMRAYRANPPAMAADESPAAAMRNTMNALSRDWGKRFDDFAKSESRSFGKASTSAATRSFAAALKKAGFTIEFKMTAVAQDIMTATIAEQVNLIKSIPEQYLTQVEGMVMRSVQAGHDMGTLAKGLQDQYGVTKRRAALIARDQNAKATAAMTRARQDEIGIEEADWMHSSAGRVPRNTHVQNNGKRYNIKLGWLDPAVGIRIWPGTLVGCRCVSRSIIPGLE